MSRIEETIEVGVPVRVAYDQWTQFEEFPRFMDGVEEVRQLDDTHLHWRAGIAGARREWDAEITHQEPDHRICWRATSGHRNDGEVRFEPVDGDRTRVILEMEHEPEGTADQIGDRLGLAKRRAKADLERFRELVESHGAASGGWRGAVRGGRIVQGDPSAPAVGATGGGTIGRTADRGAVDGPASAGGIDPVFERPRDDHHGDPAGTRPAGDLREDLTEGPTPETRAAMEASDDGPAHLRRDLTEGPTPETREAGRRRDDDPSFRDTRRGI